MWFRIDFDIGRSESYALLSIQLVRVSKYNIIDVERIRNLAWFFHDDDALNAGVSRKLRRNALCYEFAMPMNPPCQFPSMSRICFVMTYDDDFNNIDECHTFLVPTKQ